MKRFFLCASFLLCLPSLAHHWVLQKYHHSDDNSVIGCRVYCTMCGLNVSAPVSKVKGSYCSCHGKSVLQSFVQLSSDPCDPNDDGAPVIALGGRLGDYFDDMPDGVLPAIDFDGLANNFNSASPMISYFPNGNVLTGPNGLPYVVTDSPDSDQRYAVPFVNGVAQGYQGGKAGTYALVPFEGQYYSNFVPVWSGGVSESGSSSSLSDGGSSSSVVPYGGSSSPSSGSTVFDTPSTTPKTNDVGTSYNVVSVPSQTVSLSNGSSLTVRDYTDLLNAIGRNLSSGFNKVHDDVSTLNENLRKQLETEENVDVLDNVDPSIDDQSVSEDVNEQLDLIRQPQSGWGFDFGMGSNPIGEVITRFFGNPPTSFGSQDNVCSVSFTLPLVGSLQYEFVLSRYFPSAFRSCMLMILSIVFAIASAKAVSGAFQ